MDNNTKLTEGLLKADGIDPAGATESERIALTRMLDEQSKLKQSKPGIAWPDVWRTIMKHRSTRLAAAAAIIVAAAIGLSIFSGPQSVALADVAREIEHFKNCVFKKTTTGCVEDDPTNTYDSLVYYTKDAVREDIFEDEKVILQVYVRSSEAILVVVNHKTREFTRMELPDEDIEKLSPVSPKNIVNLILGKGKYKKLGRKTVDGVLSDGFEFSDTRAMLSMDKEMIKSIVTRLWVDIKTNLPVRVEVECVLVNDSKANVVMSDPEWDVELEPDFFEPKIPDGYMEPGQRGLIGINLEDWPTLKVVPGMPAEKAGVKSGDVVVQINGDSISHVKSSGDALTLLSGKAGDKVAITVERGEQTLTFEIERSPAPKN